SPISARGRCPIAVILRLSTTTAGYYAAPIRPVLAHALRLATRAYLASSVSVTAPPPVAAISEMAIATSWGRICASWGKGRSSPEARAPITAASRRRRQEPRPPPTRPPRPQLQPLPPRRPP